MSEEKQKIKEKLELKMAKLSHSKLRETKTRKASSAYKAKLNELIQAFSNADLPSTWGGLVFNKKRFEI